MSNNYITNMSPEERAKNLEKARKTRALKKQLEAKGIFGLTPDFYVVLYIKDQPEQKFETVDKAKEYLRAHKKDLFTVHFHYGHDKGNGEMINESVSDLPWKEALAYFKPFCEEAETLGLI